MKRAKLIMAACFTAVLSLTLMNASAQDFIGLEKSILTFSAPIELPNKTLPAGTYVFKRTDFNTPRVIQVLSEDEKTVHGQYLTVPTQRLEVTGDNVVTFKETAAGATPAVRFWYYPGKEAGHEFVYSKEQAMRIAARTNQTVMTDQGEINAQGQVVGDNAGKDTSASAAVEPAPAAAPAPEPAPEAVVAQAKPAQRSDTVGTSGSADANATDELPKTASPLALSGLLGLLSLGGALSLRRLR